MSHRWFYFRRCGWYVAHGYLRTAAMFLGFAIKGNHAVGGDPE